VTAYKTVRGELKKYNEELTEKPEMIILTKTDVVSAEDVIAKQKALKRYGVVFPVSVIDEQSVKILSDAIVDRLNKK
jgi:GTP-binding protein